MFSISDVFQIISNAAYALSLSRILKQVPAKPTVRTGPIAKQTPVPGPAHYDQPPICGGKGFSKIKRAPAYTFGRVLNPYFPPPVRPNAPLVDVSGINAKLGSHKIPGGLMTPSNWPPGNRLKVPGPGTHEPLLRVGVKRAPAYSMRLAAKPPYQPYDMWTPPANMYWPPLAKKKAPAYTFRNRRFILPPFNPPGPGAHHPNHKYVQKTKPAVSFAPPFRPLRIIEKTPAPNVYCEQKFMVGKPSIPAPSFGIRHTPYLGNPGIHTKPLDLEQRMSRV